MTIKLQTDASLPKRSIAIWLKRSDVQLGLILVIALAVRLYRLDYHSLWFDEAISGLASKFDASTIITQHLDPPAPPVYFFLLHYWTELLRLIGITQPETVLRSLSVVFSTFAILPIYFIGRKLYNPRVGTYAAILTAILPFQIHYAQEARFYGLVILWSAMALLVFIHALASDSKRTWVALVLICVAGLYIHYIFGLLVVALHVFAVAVPARRRLLFRLALLDVVLAISLLPLLATILNESTQYVALPSLLAPLLTLAFLVFGYSSSSSWLVAMGLFSVLMLFGLLLPPAIREIRLKSEPPLLLLCIVFVPMLLVLGLSYLVQPIYFDRYFSIVTPALSVFIAQGLVLRSNRVLKLFAAVLLLLFAAQLVSDYYQPDIAKPPFRAAGVYLAEHFEPGDIVFHVHDSTYASFYLYQPDLPQYLWQDDAGTWLFPSAWKWYGTRIADLAPLFEGHNRIWVVSLPGTLDASRRALIAQINQRYPQTLDRHFDNLEVSLYGTPSTP